MRQKELVGCDAQELRAKCTSTDQKYTQFLVCCVPEKPTRDGVLETWPMQGSPCPAAGIQQHQGSRRLCLDHHVKQQ